VDVDQTERVYEAEYPVRAIYDNEDIQLDDAEAFLRNAIAAQYRSYRSTPSTLLDVDEIDPEPIFGKIVAGLCARDGIHIRRGHLSRWVLLHELAHWLTSDGHGPEFCYLFLDLLGVTFGHNARDALRASFEDHGVAVASIEQSESEPDKYAATSFLAAYLQEEEDSIPFEQLDAWQRADRAERVRSENDGDFPEDLGDDELLAWYAEEHGVES